MMLCMYIKLHGRFFNLITPNLNRVQNIIFIFNFIYYTYII